MSRCARLVIMTMATLPLGGFEIYAQQPAGNPTPSAVFDTYTPGPCNPNGQDRGNCPPGTLARVRLVPVATGLNVPRHIALMPNDRDLLVAESAGTLLLARADTSETVAVAGWPVAALGVSSLQSVVLHPRFEQNGFVYLYYVKRRADGLTTMALARGRLRDANLEDVRELFVAEAWVLGGPATGRAAFGPDGMLYLTTNDHDRFFSVSDDSIRKFAQDLGNDLGKVMRLRDDGTAPPDNPFVGRAGARPEVFTYGHRNATGLAWLPTTGAIWSTEIGPMAGDELNVLAPGKNYGWPLVSLGKIYNNQPVSEQSWFRPGMEMPEIYWAPSISPSSLLFYNGARFPLWKGHLFITALNGQMLQRVAFNQPEPQTERREAMFIGLGRRFRHVIQSADGYLYVAAERSAEDHSGVVFRVEPAN
ncbi:MAG: PQQ-dependent sugar dehydrogenase [Vicinamibacterales bacterium]